MDIPNGHLFRYDPRNDGVERVFEGPVLGAATLQKDGTIALFGIHGGIWLWRETRLDVVTAIPEARGTRFNDALADPSGRVLSGTMPTPARPSVLYAIEPNGRYRVVLDGLGQSNGMALSADHRTLFHVDTRATLVRACAYEVETGDARDPRVLVQFASSDGVPDGAALDAEGCLWVAMWGGRFCASLESGWPRHGSREIAHAACLKRCVRWWGTLGPLHHDRGWRRA